MPGGYSSLGGQVINAYDASQTPSGSSSRSPPRGTPPGPSSSRWPTLTALLFANSGSAGIGARAGYPSISIPAGYQASNRRPFNISFLGPAWSEPILAGYAYAYEQATLLHQPPSAINPTLFS